MSRNVVIIGGGATAVSAFRSLVRIPGVASICFIAPNAIGCGTAFGAGDPQLLCNTSVDVTSLSPEGDSELLGYLAARGWPVQRDDFVPRYLVTQYARESYLRHRADAELRGVRVMHLRGLARSVGGTTGRYRVKLADGRSMAATDVLLCLNGTTPRLPEALRARSASPRLLTSPYPARRLRQIPPGSSVLVVGTKLSALDAALTLCRRGLPTVMTSPSGELPAVRTRLCRTSAAGLAQQWEEQLHRGAGPAELLRPLLRLIRALGNRRPVLPQLSRVVSVHERLRHETAQAETGHVPWQDAVAEVIDGLNVVLPKQPEHIQRQVLAAYRGAMSRYISSIPVSNARRILAHLDSGALRVAGAYPQRIDPHPGDGWTVTWPDGRTEHVDWIVCASGFEAPSLAVTKAGELRIGAPTADGDRPAVVGHDLRIVRDPWQPPERLWALGAAAGSRFPIVNYLRAAAQHATTVARQLSLEPWRAAHVDPAVRVPAARLPERTSS
ncbi:FAD/NAD(P)-binding protein [Streptomyces sp. NPDC017993]|uniref:FAD/NAD(P)-binding protein n=1 Tax=Streptomyces sp. NPDC017993 TaxID=3365027 RepID=UPI0037A98C82